MSKLKGALVGSRNLTKVENEFYLKIFYKICYSLACKGIIIRSGGADGADLVAEQAYSDAISNKRATEDQVEIFVPWKPFQAVRGEDNPLYYLHKTVTNKSVLKRCEDLVKEVHPAFDKLSQGALKLHCRNMNQFFGEDLDSKVDFVLCYTDGGLKRGGTASVISLAEKYGVPVFNIGKNIEQVKIDFKEFLKQKGVNIK